MEVALCMQGASHYKHAQPTAGTAPTSPVVEDHLRLGSLVLSNAGPCASPILLRAAQS